MYKKLSVLMAAAMISVGVAAQSSANDALSDSLNTAGVLTVCISKNAYPPLYWKESGELTGFDVASLEAITEKLGLKLRFMEVAFDGLMPGLVSGRCDMMRSGLYINEDRTRVADAIPYLKTGPALLVLSGEGDDINSAGDLSGKTVAAQSASANAAILGKLSESLEDSGQEGIDISLYPELPETVAAVRNHRADALIETDVAAAAVASNLKGQLEVVGGLFDAGTMFGMYFPKNSPLEDAVKQVAIDLTEDGTFAKIAERFGLQPKNVASVEDIEG